jgi:hypothetical protein
MRDISPKISHKILNFGRPGNTDNFVSPKDSEGKRAIRQLKNWHLEQWPNEDKEREDAT